MFHCSNYNQSNSSLYCTIEHFSHSCHISLSHILLFISLSHSSIHLSDSSSHLSLSLSLTLSLHSILDFLHRPTKCARVSLHRNESQSQPTISDLTDSGTVAVWAEVSQIQLRCDIRLKRFKSGTKSLQTITKHSFDKKNSNARLFCYWQCLLSTAISAVLGWNYTCLIHSWLLNGYDLLEENKSRGSWGSKSTGATLLSANER